MTRAGTLLIAALLSVACTGGPVAPDATPLSLAPSPKFCLDALLEGELLRDEASGFLVRHQEGFVTPVTWPDGYAVRDAEVRELLDPAGRVVAREGDLVALGGGEFDSPRTFHVCGPFTVTPAN